MVASQLGSDGEGAIAALASVIYSTVLLELELRMGLAIELPSAIHRDVETPQ